VMPAARSGASSPSGTVRRSQNAKRTDRSGVLACRAATRRLHRIGAYRKTSRPRGVTPRTARGYNSLLFHFMRRIKECSL
jgi:hypothetical protein